MERGGEGGGVLKKKIHRKAVGGHILFFISTFFGMKFH